MNEISWTRLYTWPSVAVVASPSSTLRGSPGICSCTLTNALRGVGTRIACVNNNDRILQHAMRVYLYTYVTFTSERWQSSLFMNIRVFCCSSSSSCCCFCCFCCVLSPPFVIFLATQVTDPSRLTFDETKTAPNVNRTTDRCG